MNPNINNITIIDPIIMTTEAQTPTVEKHVISLTEATPEQLKQALAKIEGKKNEDRETYKTLVSETVPKAMYRLCAASENLSNAKTETFKYFEQVLDLKNKVYGLKEKRQSHTFSTEKEEITIGYRINDGWDDTVTAGIQKVENYLSSLSKNEETASLVGIVFNLLKKDAKGNLKGSRVLELQAEAAKSKNEEFIDGVEIIANAYKPTRSSWFIEAALINEDGSKTNIPLSMSSVGFSAGYKFEFFNEALPQENATK
jgi:hypothetical protein